MRFEYIKSEYKTIVQGTILQEDGTPEKSCLVVLYSISNAAEVARKSTDNKGKYIFEYVTAGLVAGQYEIRFYGAGDWAQNVYSFEIASLTGPPDVYIESSNGLTFKWTDAGYVPASTELTVKTNNIYNPVYEWSIDNATTQKITVQGTALNELHYLNVSCTVHGETVEGYPTPIHTATISLGKTIDGSAGPGVVYRGVYDDTKYYYKTSTRRDVVTYQGSFYICKSNVTPDQGWQLTHWESFGAQFSSVATGLLLAEDAVITNILTLGALDSAAYGTIRSANAVSLDNGNGFYISANQELGLFRVGSDTQFLKWDGTNLRVKSDYFDLTTSGKLWASQGGFGGSVSSPKIELTSTGFKAGETYLHGNSSWTAPTDVQLNTADNGTVFNLVGTGSDMAETFAITESDIEKIFSITFHVEGTGGETTDIHKGYVYMYFTPTGGTEVLVVTAPFNVGNGLITSKSVSYYADAVGSLRIQIAYSACNSTRPVMVLD